MYEVNSDKFTSKPNPKKEFANYFKESGAASALQKAMLLLYRMPVKPTNLAEFFSQYFENGAQQLMKISLLKSELCYKRDELQNKRLKVLESENRIKQMIDTLGITDEEFNQKFVPERIKEKNRLSILERYFKDMESGLLKPTAEETTYYASRSSYFDAKAEMIARQDINYDLENDCMKNVGSDNALKEDIKELDPWGIICKGSKGGDEIRMSFPRDRDHELDAIEGHGDDNHELDEDDATSLAELFQQSSRDWIIQDRDENEAKSHNRLLMVKRADTINMSDFLGWSPLQSRENLAISGTPQKEQTTSEGQIRDNYEIESLKRRPCSHRVIELTTPQGVPLEPDSDAFLLEEDNLEHVYKLMETTQESFNYEFQRYSREPCEGYGDKEGISEPICDLADLSHICSASEDSIEDGGIYGEDDYENESLNESLGFIPGTMSNWTNQYMDYPSCSTTAGEYFEFNGEDDLCGASTFGSGQNSRSQKSRIDSSCHCLFTGSFNIDEILSESNVVKDEETITSDPVEVDNSSRKSTLRGGRVSLQRDEATITEDSVLENELQEVFKQKQYRRSSINKEKEKNEEETEEPSHIIDVFGIDLAKEVKRTILGIKPSEVNNNAVVPEEQAHQRSSNGAPKSQGKPNYVFATKPSSGIIFPYKK